MTGEDAIKQAMLGYKDPTLVRLEELATQQQELKELLEEILERLADMELPYNSL